METQVGPSVSQYGRVSQCVFACVYVLVSVYVTVSLYLPISAGPLLLTALGSWNIKLFHSVFVLVPFFFK